MDLQLNLWRDPENPTLLPRWTANHPPQIGQIDSCLVICNVVLGCVWATLRVMADPRVSAERVWAEKCTEWGLSVLSKSN